MRAQAHFMALGVLLSLLLASCQKLRAEMDGCVPRTRYDAVEIPLITACVCHPSAAYLPTLSGHITSALLDRHVAGARQRFRFDWRPLCFLPGSACGHPRQKLVSSDQKSARGRV